MSAGGAERVMATLCNHWVAEHDVFLITLASWQAEFHHVSDRVRRTRLSVLDSKVSGPKAIAVVRSRIRALSAAIADTKCDVVVSFIDKVNIMTIFAVGGLNVPVLACERTYPPLQPLPTVWALLRMLAYPRAARVVVQTQAAVPWARRFQPARRIVVLPNPLSELFLRRPASTPPRSKTIVAIGRLSSEKGFDLLIDAFSMVQPEYPDWQLLVFGDGPVRAELQTMAARSPAGDRIVFPGITQQPADELLRAGIFALSSRYEGFPNVLLEAMAMGCPVVATDCMTGPRELLEDGKTGILVRPNDSRAIAAGLRELLNDPGKRSRYGAAAAVRASGYSVGNVAQRWDAAIAEAVAEVARMRAS